MTRARASYWGSAVIFGFREAPTRCFEERLDPSPAVSIFAGRDLRPGGSPADFFYLAVASQRAAVEHVHDAVRNVGVCRFLFRQNVKIRHERARDAAVRGNDA